MSVIEENVKKQNDKIAWLNSICCIMVVLIHAESFIVRLPEKTINTYGNNFSTFLQLFISEGVARIAVPIFFIISGYLFFNKFKWNLIEIKKKYKRKLSSYVIPYVFWGSLVTFFYYFTNKVPYLSNYITSRDIGSWDFIDVIYYSLIQPANSPLWFLRNLIVITIGFPLIFKIIKNKILAKSFLIILFCAWLIFQDSWYIVESVLFFSLGAYVAINGNPLSDAELNDNKKKIIAVIISMLWILILFFKTIWLSNSSIDILLFGTQDVIYKMLNKTNILVGLFAINYQYDFIFSKSKYHDWLVTFQKYSFLIFVMHHPIITVSKKIMAYILVSKNMNVSIVYIGSTVLTIVLIYLIYKSLMKHFNPLFLIITGSRK